MACAALTGAINLAPDCAALKKTGGLNKRIYVGSGEDVASHTVDPTTKELKTLVMKSGKKLVSATGKKYKNSATTGIEQTENGPLYPHNVTFVAYYSTQLEKENFLEPIAAVDDLFVVVETNWGKFEAYGLLAQGNQLGEGMTVTATGGTGTNAEDPAFLTLTFAGRENKLPVFAAFGVDNAADKAYLDALLTPAV